MSWGTVARSCDEDSGAEDGRNVGRNLGLALAHVVGEGASGRS